MKLIYPKRLNITQEQIQWFYNNKTHLKTRAIISLSNLTVILHTITDVDEIWVNGKCKNSIRDDDEINNAIKELIDELKRTRA